MNSNHALLLFTVDFSSLKHSGLVFGCAIDTTQGQEAYTMNRLEANQKLMDAEELEVRNR